MRLLDITLIYYDFPIHVGSDEYTDIRLQVMRYKKYRMLVMNTQI